MTVTLAELEDYVRQNFEANTYPHRHPDHIFGTFRKYHISLPKQSAKQYENCLKNINWLIDHPQKMMLLEQRAEQRGSPIRSPSYRGLRSPSYRGPRSPSYRGIGSPPFRGLGSPSYRGMGSPYDSPLSPIFRGRGSPTRRGRMKGRFRGWYRGRGRGYEFIPGTFELPPPFQAYHQPRGRGGAYKRARRGRRGKRNNFNEYRWSGIERKLARLERRMDELCGNQGAKQTSSDKSGNISSEECERAINIAMSKLERIDQAVATDYKSIGLPRQKSEQKLLKLLTIDDVVAAQEKAFNRVAAVVAQAKEQGVFVRQDEKVVKELFNRYDNILRRVEQLDAKMGDIVITC